MAFIFWVIVVVAAVFGFVSPRFPDLAPYGWFPWLILFILLGLRVFGFPH